MTGSAWRVAVALALALIAVVGSLLFLVALGRLQAGSAAYWAAAVGTVGALFAALFGLLHQAKALRGAEAERTEAMRQTQRQLDTAQEQARATQKQVEIARQGLAASIRPLLVDAPRGQAGPRGTLTFYGGMGIVCQDPGALHFPRRGDGPFADVAVPVLNVGPGVALLRGIGIGVRPDVGWSGRFGRTVLRAGEQTFLVFSVPKDRPELADLREAISARTGFSVQCTYTNTVGAT